MGRSGLCAFLPCVSGGNPVSIPTPLSTVECDNTGRNKKVISGCPLPPNLSHFPEITHGVTITDRRRLMMLKLGEHTEGGNEGLKGDEREADVMTRNNECEQR